MVKRAVAACVIIFALGNVASYIVIYDFHIIPSTSYFAPKHANYSKLLTKAVASYKINSNKDSDKRRNL